MADAGSERPTAFQQAKRVYRTGSFFWRAYNWLGVAKIGAGNVAAGVTAASVVAAGSSMIVYDAVDHQIRAKATPPPVVMTRWDDNSVVFPITGFDKAGRKASFNVLLLTKEYSWSRGSTNELVKSGRTLSPAEVLTEVFSNRVRDGLKSARELIAVGIASQEGNPETELQRAGLRARQTAEWTRAALGPEVRMLTLNLGQYRVACTACETGDTTWQRPFVLIAIREEQDGVVIAEALANAMTDRVNVPSPESYSAFRMDRFN